MRNYLSFLTLLGMIWLLFSASSRAEQFKQLGDWEVHYIAFNSTFLTPEMARNYGIERSRYKGLLNITILNQAKQPQLVTISGKAKNLLGTLRQLAFKEIREGEAVYYIAEVPHRNEETYRFDIEISQSNHSATLQFQHKFYVD